MCIRDSGTVEALEPIDSDSWVISVQWHPEDTAARDPQQQPVSYTHLRAHETVLDLVCRLLLEKKN